MVTWGSNTTTVFGTSTPAAAPAGAAGAPAPATSGFSFGAPAAPSTPPLGGAGAPATSGFSFGGAPAPAAPAPASGGLFGAPAPAAGGLFGAPAPAPSGGGLFGAPAPAPTGGGLFGAPTPAPAGGGLFGAKAPAPSAGGLFGAPAAAPTSAFGAATQTPAQAQAPHQAAYAAHQSASQRQEAARIQEAILSLHSKYSPYASDPLNPSLGSNNIPSSLCRFTAILYDPLPPEQRAAGSYVTSTGVPYGGAIRAPKPPHISDRDWNEALARNPNPNELIPAPLVGAAALHSRLVSQQEKANTCSSHAKKIRDTLSYLEEEGRKSHEAIRYSKNEQEVLRRRLLEIMRKVEIVRCMGHPLQRGEVEASVHLNEIMKKMMLVDKALAEVEERGTRQSRAWRMRASAVDSRSSCVGNVADTSLNDEEKYELFRSLNEQRLGNETLGQCVKTDVRDIEILKEELSKASTGSSRRALPSSSVVGIFGGSR